MVQCPLRKCRACAEANPHGQITQAEDQHDERCPASAPSSVCPCEKKHYGQCRSSHHAHHHDDPHREREENVGGRPWHRHRHRHTHLHHHFVVLSCRQHLMIEIEEIPPRQHRDAK